MGARTDAVPPGARADLRPDCARCHGLCCVALPFAASADFATDKPAGTPCRHLRDDLRCDIHAHLRDRGYAGCAAFDCFGAGQRVSAGRLPERDWRRDPHAAPALFESFHRMLRLHQLLWYVLEALTLPAARPLHADLAAMRARVEDMAASEPVAPDPGAPAALRRDAGALLEQAGDLARAAAAGRGHDVPPAGLRGADLSAAALRRADLRAADLRNASLIAADLRGADLRGADLLGADLRAADLRGADLRGCVFLTPPQVAAARGDGRTRLPRGLERPPHWRGDRSAPSVRP